MVRRIILLATVLTVAVAGCRGAPEVSRERAAGGTANSEARRAPPLAMQTGPPDADPGEMETVTVTITMSGGTRESPEDAGASGPGMRPGMRHGGGCPKTQLGNMLGVVVARPHGCLIGAVEPDGRAAKAGIKRGDSIVACSGSAVSCPRDLVAQLTSGPVKREVEFTIRRPKADTGASAPEKAPLAAPAGGQAGEDRESAAAPQGAEAPKPEQPKSE